MRSASQRKYTKKEVSLNIFIESELSKALKKNNVVNYLVERIELEGITWEFEMILILYGVH